MTEAPALSQDAALHEAVLREALSGLQAHPKTLSPWLFYDDRGSQLFERITAVPEYYLTRVERRLLVEHGTAILTLAAGAARLTLLELGAGSASKTGLLLQAAVKRQGTVLYQPVDVSSSALEQAAASIAGHIPGVTVQPQVANYVTGSFTLRRAEGERALALYIGSSIGNFTPQEARGILRNLREYLQAGDSLLLGVDLAPSEHKSIACLTAAYSDEARVTESFNKNVLIRLNRELDGDFDVECFAHRARWNAEESRMEMHLESLIPQTVSLAGRRFVFAEGETIHTENSYKFTAARLAQLVKTAGFASRRLWQDSGQCYALTLAEAV
jgi:L-histidine N-alpha-methyltransferase